MPPGAGLCGSTAGHNAAATPGPGHGAAQTQPLGQRGRAQSSVRRGGRSWDGHGPERRRLPHPGCPCRLLSLPGPTWGAPRPPRAPARPAELRVKPASRLFPERSSGEWPSRQRPFCGPQTPHGSDACARRPAEGDGEGGEGACCEPTRTRGAGAGATTVARCGEPSGASPPRLRRDRIGCPRPALTPSWQMKRGARQPPVCRRTCHLGTCQTACTSSGHTHQHVDVRVAPHTPGAFPITIQLSKPE